MLAERLSSPSEITKKIGGKFAAEFKLDGERLQIHINDSSGSIFSMSSLGVTRRSIENFAKEGTVLILSAGVPSKTPPMLIVGISSLPAGVLNIRSG